MKVARRLCLTGLAIALLVTVANVTAQDAAESDAKSAQAELHQKLLGAWLLAGEAGTKDEPQPGARTRFFGHSHWCITQSSQDTGEVIFHHGGTYELEGDTLIETITYATEPTASLVGREFRFKVSVEDGTYTQIGDGNPWNESWRRAK